MLSESLIIEVERYDLCLVLDLKNNDIINNCVYNIITKKLKEAGLNVYVYKSSFEKKKSKGIGRIVTSTINTLSPSHLHHHCQAQILLLC